MAYFYEQHSLGHLELTELGNKYERSPSFGTSVMVETQWTSLLWTNALALNAVVCRRRPEGSSSAF